MAKIKVENTEISVVNVQNEDYISLTDMAHSQMQEHIIFRWMSLKSTIEYLGEWEKLYNPNFNCTEFDTIKNAAGSNNFVLSVKAWIQRTGNDGMAQSERLIKLNQIAIQQMKILEDTGGRNLLK
ncbi:KilA-N domain-containing protein [Segatella sp.]|uniref:KilA-N domain-containing protein n=1 Tax=Segatella sp. TaxID=2974253 RepID=UPI0030797ACA